MARLYRYGIGLVTTAVTIPERRVVTLVATVPARTDAEKGLER
jgi:hypothetical protein